MSPRGPPAACPLLQRPLSNTAWTQTHWPLDAGAASPDSASATMQTCPQHRALLRTGQRPAHGTGTSHCQGVGRPSSTPTPLLVLGDLGCLMSPQLSELGQFCPEAQGGGGSGTRGASRFTGEPAHTPVPFPRLPQHVLLGMPMTHPLVTNPSLRLRARSRGQRGATAAAGPRAD